MLTVHMSNSNNKDHQHDGETNQTNKPTRKTCLLRVSHICTNTKWQFDTNIRGRVDPEAEEEAGFLGFLNPLLPLSEGTRAGSNLLTRKAEPMTHDPGRFSAGKPRENSSGFPPGDFKHAVRTCLRFPAM